uniref:Transmembrane protein 200A n=1 Tax=Laticauda laticaudata TaxID=8630 RepID=A0A8C5S7V1_LATLA
MKTHNTSEKKTSGSSAPSRWHRGRFRRKTSPHMVVKGQLRMRSPSGVFVMVGISVVLMGMTIAVIGYWPHRTKSGSGRAGNSNVTGEIRKEIKVSSQARLFLHSEKLKLIGPVVMGVGLFIFICANTMLYENRDMETRLLMQQELYSMGLNFSQDTGPASNYFQRRRTTSSTLRANAECVEGYYEVDLSSSGFHVSRVGVRDLGSNCRLPEEKEEVRRLSWAFLPGCSNHVVPRKDTLKDSHVVIDMNSTPHSGILVGEFHECAKREFPNSGHSKSLDLGQPRTALVAPSIDRKHRSWPRLDHIDLLNYAKLESQGESSDRLLGASKELFRGENISLSQEIPMKTGPII